MTVLILYFSGTGNTRRVAEEFKARLEERKFTVILHSMEEHADLTKLSYDFLIVGMPKYYEYPLLPAIRYLKHNLPKSEHTVPALAFCTQAGTLKTDFTGLEKLLRKKNHRLTVEASMPYANNLLIFGAFRPTEPTELLKNREDIRGQVGPLLDAFLSGAVLKEQTKAWQKPLIYLVAASCTKLMPALAMRFSADDTCTGCGLCARQCPVKNIQMNGGRPEFRRRCLFCTRCINSCPANAIRYSGKKCPQYRCGPSLRAEGEQAKPECSEEE